MTAPRIPPLRPGAPPGGPAARPEPTDWAGALEGWESGGEDLRQKLKRSNRTFSGVHVQILEAWRLWDQELLATLRRLPPDVRPAGLTPDEQERLQQAEDRAALAEADLAAAERRAAEAERKLGVLMTWAKTAEARLLDQADALRAIEEARARGEAPAPAPTPAAAAATPEVQAVERPSAEPAASRTEEGTAGQRQELEAAFVAWCNRGGPLVGRHFMFERSLQQTVPGVVVEPVYRDRTAEPPTFGAAAADGVEYWLVRLGTTPWLLPQPQSARQFRELAPAFAGDVTPALVTAVEAARLVTDGGQLVLAGPGSVR